MAQVDDDEEGDGPGAPVVGVDDAVSPLWRRA